VSLALVIVSIALPVFGLPWFIPTFFFRTGSAFWFIDRFWVLLALFFFVVSPLLGIIGIALAKDAAAEGYANGVASARVILYCIVILIPIAVFIVISHIQF